jgi:hypothetical protein
MNKMLTVVVGTLLVGVDQGVVLTSGRIGWLVWDRIAFGYLIPTCVSSMGVLAGLAEPRVIATSTSDSTALPDPVLRNVP